MSKIRIKNDKIISLFLGIYITITIYVQHIIPTLLEDDLIYGTIVKTEATLSKQLNGYGMVPAVVAITFVYVIYKSIHHMRQHGQGVQKGVVVLGLLFGFLNEAGLCLHYFDALPISVGQEWTVLSLFLVLGWGILFYFAVYWGGWFLNKKVMSDKRCEKKIHTCKFIWWMGKHTWIVAFCVIMICWLPWIILYYPASADSDVFWMLSSYQGLITKTNHHPWFASCVLGKFYELGLFFNNENVGIFIFVLVRDIILASIYASCVRLLKKTGINRSVYIIALLFYAITPVWGAYAKHAFKDTFSAGLFCWFILCMIRLIQKTRNHEQKTRDFILYGISGVVCALFRNNFIYSVLPISVLLLIYLFKRKAKTYQMLIIVICIGMYFGYNQYIFQYVGVQKSETVEALSIPLQQTARTVKYHSNEITDEEKATIDACLPYEQLGTSYNPILSDPVKGLWRGEATSDAKKKYIVTWAKMAIEYPTTYLEAAVAQSYGYYAFTPKRTFGEGNWNSGMTIFYWCGTSSYWGSLYPNVSYGQSWDNARQMLDRWAYVWDNIPILSLTDTIAFYTWSIVLLGYMFWRKKQWSNLLPVFALLIIVLTCIASPVNDCFRYYAPVAASAPALIGLLRNKEQCD